MKAYRYYYILIMGFLCFLFSQILTRIPILNILQKNPSYIIWQMQNFLLVGFLMALSAGIFEEGFRFLFRRFLIKDCFSIKEPIVFGLGHSLMEILYLFVPLVMTAGFSSFNGIMIYERIVTTISIFNLLY